MMAAGKKKPEEKNTDTLDSTRSLRDDAEKELAHTHKPSPEMKGQTPGQLIHELRVHQIELETQAEDLRKSKIALEESRDKFIDLYDFAPLGYLTLNDKALITEVNLTGATLLGTERNNLINARFRKYIAQPDQDVWDRYFMHVLNRGEKQTCTLTLKRSDGTMFPARLESIRIIRSDGTPTVRVTVSDITDIQKVEGELKESEGRFHTMFDRHDSVMLLIDPKTGKIIDANHAAERFYGRSQKELCTQSINEINILSPEEIADEMKKAAREKMNFFTFPHRLASGEIRTVEVHSSPIEIGRKTLLFSIINDVTERKVAEEALKESEEKFRATIGQSMDGILITDGDFNIIEWNATQTTIYGYTREEMLGKPLWEFQFATMPKEQKSSGLLEKMKRRMLDHRSSPDSVWMNSLHDYTVQCGDGPCKTVQISTFPIVFRNSILFGSISRDISETKRAEEKLLVNEQKFRDIFENSVVGLFQTAPGGRMINVNEAFAHMYGFSDAAEMLAADLDVGSPPYANPEDQQKVLHILAEKGRVESYEAPHLKRDGTHFWVSITARTIRNTEGNVLLYEGTIIDITERKVAEEALRESEERLRLLSDNLPNGMIYQLVIEPDGERRFVHISAGIEKIHCVTVEDVICDPMVLYNQYLEEDRARLAEAEDFAIRNMTVFNIEARYRIPDGQVRWSLLNSTLRQMPDETIIADGFEIDITERKRVEEALNQANKKLTLLSSITRHDINNKLTVLQGYLAILKKKQPDPTFNEYFVKVSTAAQHISSMIQFTREYECLGVKAPAWQNCRTLVDTAAKDAPLGKVVVKNDLPAGTEVFADPLIVKVFYNLMDNAARYGGKITTIRFSDEEHDGDHIVVCEDDGDGVVAEEKEKIFERGFGKNTGLGLALSREILSITGITIRETGELGKGARFEMTVPKGAYRLTDVK